MAVVISVPGRAWRVLGRHGDYEIFMRFQVCCWLLAQLRRIVPVLAVLGGGAVRSWLLRRFINTLPKIPSNARLAYCITRARSAMLVSAKRGRCWPVGRADHAASLAW